MHHLSDYDYELPPGLIAQAPAAGGRDRSRLLVVDRKSRRLRDRMFGALPDLLNPGDLLVFNDTRVSPARLLGRRRTGGAVEILLLRALAAGRGRKKTQVYQALIKPLARLKDGEEILLGKGIVCRLVSAKDRIVEFPAGESARDVMNKIGILPLPPYVRRPPDARDRRRYQTVFAKYEGAVAAPTAGLHFTRRLLGSLERREIKAAFLTLHVGYGTFSPLRSLDIRRHAMHEEFFHIPARTIRRIREVKKKKGRVIAVGTTVARALEDSAQEILDEDFTSSVRRGSRLFIHPPFAFRIADAMITNFHLPRTSLLVLVAAFAGRQLMLRAYRHAVAGQYRFYSYGDAMLIV